MQNEDCATARSRFYAKRCPAGLFHAGRQTFHTGANLWPAQRGLLWQEPLINRYTIPNGQPIGLTGQANYRQQFGKLRIGHALGVCAIPELLGMLELKGSIVTIDSMGCQTEIAKTIQTKEADYLFALKGNHSHLHEQVQEFFKVAEQHEYLSLLYKPYETCEKGHGRIETRRVVALSSEYLEQVSAWPWQGLKSMVMVESVREISDKRSSELRYYISSLSPDSQRIGQAIRAH